MFMSNQKSETLLLISHQVALDNIKAFLFRVFFFFGSTIILGYFFWFNNNIGVLSFTNTY